MGKLTADIPKGHNPYHPVIPIPADMDRPEMLPAPEITIVVGGVMKNGPKP